MSDWKSVRRAVTLAGVAAILLVACGAQEEGVARKAAAPETPSEAGDDYEQAAARADALCKSLPGPQPPGAVGPGAVATGALNECDAVALYYGIGEPSDPAQARACALAEVARGFDPGLYGHGVLVNVHANGRGGPRDLDLAIRYACDDGMASGYDRTKRVNRLAALKAGAASATPFDYCDDVSSDYSVGQCMNVETGRAEDERTRRYAALTAGWPADRKSALEALRRAEDALAEARSERETDMGGTDRFIIGRGVRESVHVFTFELFQQAAAGGLAPGSTEGVVTADRSLNTAYRAVMASEAQWSGGHSGAITGADVRTTQRAWLKYRDAWLVLARLSWPRSADAVAMKVIDTRTRQLKCVASADQDACAGV